MQLFAKRFKHSSGGLRLRLSTTWQANYALCIRAKNQAVSCCKAVYIITQQESQVAQ